MNNFNIILASNSQRRKELLKFIFNEFKVIPANIDERTLERKFLSKTTKDDKSKYSELCDILSLEKCKKVAKDYKSSLIVSADTIVYDDKYLFGKPNNYEEAKHMLEYLSGKEHIVQTSITIYFKDTFSTFSEKPYVHSDSLRNSPSLLKTTSWKPLKVAIPKSSNSILAISSYLSSR